MNTRSAFRSPIGSVRKHPQGVTDTHWPRANSGRAQRPAELSAPHQATLTAGTTWFPLPWIRAQHDPRDLWLRLHPNSAPPEPTQLRVSYRTHQAKHPPPSALAGLIHDPLVCPRSANPPGPYRRMRVTATLESSKGSQRSSKNTRVFQGGAVVPYAVRKTPSFCGRSAENCGTVRIYLLECGYYTQQYAASESAKCSPRWAWRGP